MFVGVGPVATASAVDEQMQNNVTLIFRPQKRETPIYSSYHPDPSSTILRTTDDRVILSTTPN
jgi:hypothetical protein